MKYSGVTRQLSWLAGGGGGGTLKKLGGVYNPVPNTLTLIKKTCTFPISNNIHVLAVRKNLIPFTLKYVHCFRPALISSPIQTDVKGWVKGFGRGLTENDGK